MDGQINLNDNQPAIDPHKIGGVGKAITSGMNGDAVTATGVLSAIGGWRGVVESLLPAFTFLVTFVITQDARISAIVPIAVGLLAIVVRVLQKQPVTPALAGALGVVICAAATLVSGKGEDFFLPGFWINGAWVAAYLISLLVGWPLIGLLLGFFRGSFTEWRSIPVLRSAANWCTILWILVFGSRLAVQLPLYYAENVEGLGVARLVMGVPLFAIAVLFTWLVLSRVSKAVPEQKSAEGAQ